MDVARLAQEVRVDHGASQVADRSREREHRAILAAGQDDRDARRTIRQHRDRRRVDAVRPQLIAHEPSEDVVADHGGERDTQPELGRAAREDGSRPADDHPSHRRRAAPPARTPAPPRRRAARGPGWRHRAPGRRSPTCDAAYRARGPVVVRRMTTMCGMPRIVLVQGDITVAGRRRDRERGQHVAASGRRRRRRHHQGRRPRRARRPRAVIRERGDAAAPDGRRRRDDRRRAPGAVDHPYRRSRLLGLAGRPPLCSRAATRASLQVADELGASDRRVPGDLDRHLRLPARRGRAGGDRRRSTPRRPRSRYVRFVLFDGAAWIGYEMALADRRTG